MIEKSKPLLNYPFKLIDQKFKLNLQKFKSYI